VPTAAKHPVTEDVYVANNGLFRKWDQASATWSNLNVVDPATGQAPQWQFIGSFIDAQRNRWVFMTPFRIAYVDLATLAYSTIPTTGLPPSTAGVAPYAAAVHDLDNDRYLLATDTRLVAVNPDTGAAAVIATIPAAANGVNGRLTYFQALGGVAYLPAYGSDIRFMPTR
jgi:hypothetical protein